MKSKISVYIKDNFGNGILHNSCNTNKTDILEILLNYNLDINELNNNKRTPLHIAAMGGYNKLVKLLIKNGAKKNLLNINNKTAYNLAFNSQYYNTENIS